MNFTPAASSLHTSGSSGEFHTFRLPVPSLRLDILQKAKAAGLSAISVYIHWGLLNPAPGVIDLGSFRAVQPLFDAAMATGVWVDLRPGSYINAETTAGGMAHWVASQVEGELRLSLFPGTFVGHLTGRKLRCQLSWGGSSATAYRRSMRPSMTPSG